MNTSINTSSSYKNNKRPCSWRYAFVASSFILLILAVAPNAAKADTDWNGVFSDDWFNSFNWNGGLPPKPANGTTNIVNGGTPKIAGGAANAGSLLIVDKSSTLTLSVGSLTAVNERLGLSSTGRFTQSGGTNQATNLSIGYVVLGEGFTSSGTGTYDLNGGALNVSGASRVGEGGAGSFNQTGGNHTAGLLILGGRVEFPDGTTSNPGLGAYTLSDGSLTVKDKTEVGLSGKGIFNQDGGTYTTLSLYVGHAGIFPSGSFSGFGDGTYNLSSGALSVSADTRVGYVGKGTFNQTGGAHTVTDTLAIGQSGGQGTYNLSGGGSVLTASNEYIGLGGLGSFTQTNGTHTVNNTLFIGSSAAILGSSNGTYALNGGWLNATNETVGDGNGNNGTFTQTGGTHTVSDTLTIGQFGGQGTYNLSGGSVLTASYEYIGGRGLGSFTQTDGTHTVSNALSIGSSAGEAGGNGTYALDGGGLNVTDEIVGDGNGSTGTFNQSGGTHTVSDKLTIGQFLSQSNYNLSGGGSVLTASNEYIGLGGLGSFTQIDGTHTVNNSLFLGSSASGGEDGEYGGNGTYALNGGSLNATDEIAGDGNGSIGAFTQTGGTHTVSDTLTIGQSGGQGTYTLSGGGSVLTAYNEYIGLGGLGGFTQTSGTHTINNTLAIGSSAGGAGGNGTYALNGGSLNAANEIIGDGNGNTGAFTQTGGTHSVNKMLTIGNNGSYLLSGGTLSAPNLINNNSFDQSGGAYSGTFHNNKQFIYSGGSFDGSLINDGTAIFNPSLQQASFGANISGTGSLTKQGNDTLILTGDNSYRGGTTVSGGVLQGNTDSLKGDILNNASVVFDQANTGTYAGAMSGTGSLTKQNGGTLILTGDNNYSGRTTVSGGVLQGNTDSLKGNIINNATVIFDQANTGTYAGTMSGTGSLTKQNGGTLFLTGNNRYNGGTNLNGGTLSVVSDNNLGDQAGALNFNGGILQVANTGFTSTARRINWGTAGGGFNISNVFTVNQSLGGQGGLTKQGNGALILTGANNYSGGTTVSGGVLQGNTDSLKGDILNNATVMFDQANTGTYTGTMSGTGNLIKQNSGLLVFNSANNTYAGGTEVIQGNLQVGDASHPDASISGPVMIDPTGILSGHGAINGNVNNAGILSPGGSIGTLNVNGNVNFTSSSIFNVEINPLEASLLNVSGQASLGNANVSVLANNGTYSPHTYTILNAGSVSGVFNNVNIVNAADIPSLKMLTPSLQFFPNRVDLSLDVASDPTGPGTSITDKWFKTTLRTVGGRLNAPLGKSCPQNSLGFWARGVGMVSSADTSGDAPRYDGGTAGVVVGVDGQFGEHLSFGIAGFTAHTDATTYQSSNNQSTVDSGGVSLYGAYTLGAWQFKSVIGYDNDTYKAQRNIAVSSASRQAQSKTSGNRVNNYTEASYSFKSGNLTLQPVAGLQLGWMRRDGFNETGPNSDGQNISVNGRTLYALDTLVGLRTRHELPINDNLKAQLELRTFYDHDFGTLQDSVAASLSNGQTRLLSTADRPTQRDAGIVGASVALLSTHSLNFYLDYNGEIRSGQQAHFIGAGVRYSW